METSGGASQIISSDLVSEIPYGGAYRGRRALYEIFSTWGGSSSRNRPATFLISVSRRRGATCASSSFPQISPARFQNYLKPHLAGFLLLEKPRGTSGFCWNGPGSVDNSGGTAPEDQRAAWNAKGDTCWAPRRPWEENKKASRPSWRRLVGSPSPVRPSRVAGNTQTQRERVLREGPWSSGGGGANSTASTTRGPGGREAVESEEREVCGRQMFYQIERKRHRRRKKTGAGGGGKNRARRFKVRGENHSPIPAMVPAGGRVVSCDSSSFYTLAFKKKKKKKGNASQNNSTNQ